MKKLILFIITSILFTIVYLSIQNTYSIYVKTVNRTLTVTTPKLEAVFLPGPDFNAKIKQLAGDNNPAFNTNNTNITSIVRSNVLTITPTSNNIVSTSDSSFPIYAWYDSGVLYYYTEVEHPYINEDADSMFRQFTNLTSIDISTIDTSRADIMWGMFWGLSSLTTIDVSNFNISNASNIGSMFNSCTSLEEIIGLENFNTSNVEDIREMFKGCSSLENIDLSSFDISKVTIIYDMLLGTTNLKELKTPKVYPNDTSMVITLSKTMYDSNLVGYTTLGKSTTPTSPIETIIKEGYTVTFNADGGSVNPSTKIVRYGETYGALPTPTKTGYTFTNWEGGSKNLLNLYGRTKGTLDGVSYDNSIRRDFDFSKYYVGISVDNYYGEGNVIVSEIVNNKWNVKNVNGGYGVGFPVQVKSSTKYTVSHDGTQSIGIGYYDASGNYLSYAIYGVRNFTFTTPNNCTIITVVLRADDINSLTIYPDIQLEEGETVTTYESYYVTSNTTVAKLENHTLKAIWAPNAYTVNFNSNGGTGTMQSQTMLYGSSYTLNSNQFTMNDYNFGGWNGIFYSSNTELTGTNEFMQYVDLAPYFDNFGVNNKYHLELDIKPANITGTYDCIDIYFQNGETSKYAFKTIDGQPAYVKTITFNSTDYVHVSFDFEVTLANINDPVAMLAFYGGYDSGRRPIVKNVRVSIIPELKDGQTVTNLSTGNDITLYARWKKLLYSNNAELNPSNDLYPTDDAFMQYVDLAPYIDANGEDSVYNLEFDIKSENITNSNNMQVYFQNGNGSKYGLYYYVNVTTEYQHVNLDFIPSRGNEDTYSILAFYGGYGTGNKPWVKNVRFSVYKR